MFNCLNRSLLKRQEEKTTLITFQTVCVLDESLPKNIPLPLLAPVANKVLRCARLPTRISVMSGRDRSKTGLLPPACPFFPSLSSLYLLQSTPISCCDHNGKRHFFDNQKVSLGKDKKMSERYFTIGVPMTDLPRPSTGAQQRIEV